MCLFILSIRLDSVEECLLLVRVDKGLGARFSSWWLMDLSNTWRSKEWCRLVRWLRLSCLVCLRILVFGESDIAFLKLGLVTSSIGDQENALSLPWVSITMIQKTLENRLQMFSENQKFHLRLFTDGDQSGLLSALPPWSHFLMADTNVMLL